MERQLRIDTCLGKGWEGFKKNAGTAIGILLIYMVLVVGGGMIPFVNFVFNIIVAPVLSAGLNIFALKAARGDEAKVDDLFKGFNSFGSFLGAYWLYAAIVIAAIIPAGIAFLVEMMMHGWSFGFVPQFTIAVGAAGIVLLVMVMLRLSMVYYLIIDGMTVLDAFRESARLTKGHAWKLFLLVLLLGLIMLLGVLLLFVGTLVTAPICMIAFAAAYESLKGSGAAGGVAVQAPGAGPTPPGRI